MSKLQDSISKLASLYENGELLASASPDVFLDIIYDDLKKKTEIIMQLKDLIKWMEANK